MTVLMIAEFRLFFKQISQPVCKIPHFSALIKQIYKTVR